MAVRTVQTSQANQVFLNDRGVIEIHVVGDQTEASVAAMGAAAERLAEQCHRRGEPVMVLDNLMQIGKVPPEGRRQVVEYAKKVNYERLAMVGSSALLRLGANLLIQAVGKGDRVRYFEDLGKAECWLLIGLPVPDQRS